MLPTAEFHIWVPVAVTVATGMEPWAAFVHHKVWHGPLWGVHESHHVERVGYFEKNDIFAALHALPAMALIVGSSYTAWQPLAALMFGFGLGMTIFGCAYAVIHDGLIHERLPIQFLLRFRVMRRIRGAHMRHHLNGEYPYGLFLGPQELRRAVLRGEG